MGNWVAHGVVVTFDGQLDAGEVSWGHLTANEHPQREAPPLLSQFHLQKQSTPLHTFLELSLQQIPILPSFSTIHILSILVLFLLEFMIKKVPLSKQLL